MMDHGPLSGIRRTSTPAQRRKEAAGIERTIDKAMADVAAAKAAAQAEASAAYALRTAPVPFTEDELKTARIVRTKYGWYRTLRVNVKTVKVHTAFGEQLIPKPQILEVRA